MADSETYSMTDKCQHCKGSGLLEVEFHKLTPGAKKPSPTPCADCAGTGLRDGKKALAAGMTIPSGYGARLP